MLLRLGAEAQRIDQFQRVAQAVAAAELVGDFAENLADLVFDRVGVVRPRLESAQVGEQLAVDEVDQVGAGQRVVVVERTVGRFGRRPGRPAIGRVDDEGVSLAVQLGEQLSLLLQVVQVLQEQHPRGLLGVVELRGAARLLPQHVVDVLERLLEAAAAVVGPALLRPGGRPLGRLWPCRVGGLRCGDRVHRPAICQSNRAAASAPRQHKGIVYQLSADGLIGVFLPAQLAAESGVARAAAELTQSFQKTLAQRLAHHSPTTPITFLVIGRLPTCRGGDRSLS